MAGVLWIPECLKLNRDRQKTTLLLPHGLGRKQKFAL